LRVDRVFHDCPALSLISIPSSLETLFGEYEGLVKIVELNPSGENSHEGPLKMD
jgi:hypothetical protein